MEIEEILNCFKYPKCSFPKEALHAALEQQEKIVPHLLTILEYTLANYKYIDDEQMDYIFALYLLSKFREQRAFPYVLSIASLPDEWPENLLGDCITEALARFLVSTFNNDFFAIKKVVEDTTLNEWSRYSALKSFLGFIALQKLQREEVIEYLRLLFHSPLSNDRSFVAHLISTASDLYPEELMPEINHAFDANKVDSSVIDKKWIKDVLSKGRERCLQEYLYTAHHHLPIADVEKDMSWMAVFHSSKIEEEDREVEYKIWDDDSPMIETYMRSTPKIGRNALCLCGSGKKFKKCCLK